MTELYGSDAYAPLEVARRLETVGVAKARMATLPLLMLGMLAGAFIGLGSMLGAGIFAALAPNRAEAVIEATGTRRLAAWASRSCARAKSSRPRRGRSPGTAR